MTKYLVFQTEEAFNKYFPVYELRNYTDGGHYHEFRGKFEKFGEIGTRWIFCDELPTFPLATVFNSGYQFDEYYESYRVATDEDYKHTLTYYMEEYYK